MKLNRMRWALPKGHPISSFTLEEMTWDLELRAREQADALSGGKYKGTDPEALVAMECLRLSIIAVNDEPIDRSTPFIELNGWPQRTLRYLHSAFAKLNRDDDLKALKSFEQSAKVV